MNYLNDFVSLLSKLISFESIARNRNECRETAFFLKGILEEIGFSVDVIEHPEGNPVVLAEMKGTDSGFIMFYNHYDVQPPDPIEKWETDPFKLVEKNGILYGRGVGDNKGNIASRIIVVKKLLDELGELPVGVKFVIDGEEEVGSPHLLEMLQQRKKFFNDVIGVIWETGGFHRDGSLSLTLGLKGILYVEMRAKRLRRDAHSSLAVLLPSAIWDLISFLYELKRTNLEAIKSFHEGIIDVEEVLREIEEAGYEIAFYPETLKEEYGIESFVDGLEGHEALLAYFGRPTFNIDGIVAGYTGPGSKTVLPAEAYVKVDFRLVPNQDAKRIAEELCNFTKQYGIECKVHSMTEPAFTSFKHPFVQRVLKILKKMRRKVKIAPWSPASGPMHIFTKYFGLPVVSGIGVSYWSSGHHAPNENIRLQDVEEAMKIIEEILKSKEIRREE